MASTRQACTTGQLFDVLPRSMEEAKASGRIASDNNWYVQSVELMLDKIDRECVARQRKGRVEHFIDNDGFTKYWLDENPHEPKPMTFKQRGEVNRTVEQNKRAIDPMVAAARIANGAKSLPVGESNDGDDIPIDAPIDNVPEPIERWPGEAETPPTEEQITDFVAKVEKIGNKRPAWKIMLPYIPTTESEAKDPVDIAADAGLQLTQEQAKSRLRAAKYNLEKHFGKTIRHKANPSNLGNDKRRVYWIDDLKPGESPMPAPKKCQPKHEKTAANVERTETVPVPPPETGRHINPPGIPKVDPRVNIEPKLSAYDLVMGAIGTGAVVSAYVTIVEDGVKKIITFPVEEEG